jgi:hypothetical protein
MKKHYTVVALQYKTISAQTNNQVEESYFNFSCWCRELKKKISSMPNISNG